MFLRAGLRAGGKLGYLEGNIADFGVRVERGASMTMDSEAVSWAWRGLSSRLICYICLFRSGARELIFRLRLVELKLLRPALVDGVGRPCSLGSPSSVAAVGNMLSTSSSMLCRLWLLRAPHLLFQMKVASVYVCGGWQYTLDVGQ